MFDVFSAESLLVGTLAYVFYVAIVGFNFFGGPLGTFLFYPLWLVGFFGGVKLYRTIGKNYT